MSWNVQYLAGRGYVFYYDLPDGDGPDKRPSRQSIARTLDEVVHVIRQEDPDVVMLQEVDRGSSRTDGEDQLALIKAELAGAYPCTAAAYYHKAAFVPHPKILGSVGLSLGVLSKTRIAKATRYQLPHICGDPVTVAFNFDRAVLAVELPTDSGASLTAMETHLDAFAQGCDTMERQVEAVEGVLGKTTGAWLISGDSQPSRDRQGLPAPRQGPAWLLRPGDRAGAAAGGVRPLPQRPRDRRRRPGVLHALPERPRRGTCRPHHRLLLLLPGPQGRRRGRASGQAQDQRPLRDAHDRHRSLTGPRGPGEVTLRCSPRRARRPRCPRGS